MKEYTRKVFNVSEAEQRINDLAADRWQIISIEEDNGLAYVWMERRKSSMELLVEDVEDHPSFQSWLDND